MIVSPSKREDWAGIFLSAFLKGVLNDYTVRELVHFTGHVLDQLEEVETDGKEALMVLSILVHRAGGHIRITRAECEDLKEMWMRKRTTHDGNVIEYQLLDEEPREGTRWRKRKGS